MMQIALVDSRRSGGLLQPPSLDFAIELPHAFAPSLRPATVQSEVALRSPPSSGGNRWSFPDIRYALVDRALE